MASPAFGACGGSGGSTSGAPQGGTDVGNGVANASMNLCAYSNGKKAKSLSLDDGMRIDAVWMVVDRVRLRPGESCSNGEDEGPLVAELSGAGVLGGPPTFDIRPGPLRVEVTS